MSFLHFNNFLGFCDGLVEPARFIFRRGPEMGPSNEPDSSPEEEPETSRIAPEEEVTETEPGRTYPDYPVEPVDPEIEEPSPPDDYPYEPVDPEIEQPTSLDDYPEEPEAERVEDPNVEPEAGPGEEPMPDISIPSEEREAVDAADELIPLSDKEQDDIRSVIGSVSPENLSLRDSDFSFSFEGNKLKLPHATLIRSVERGTVSYSLEGTEGGRTSFAYLKNAVKCTIALDYIYRYNALPENRPTRDADSSDHLAAINKAPNPLLSNSPYNISEGVFNYSEKESWGGSDLEYEALNSLDLEPELISRVIALLNHEFQEYIRQREIEQSASYEKPSDGEIDS